LGQNCGAFPFEAKRISLNEFEDNYIPIHCAIFFFYRAWQDVQRNLHGSGCSGGTNSLIAVRIVVAVSDVVFQVVVEHNGSRYFPQYDCLCKQMGYLLIMCNLTLNTHIRICAIFVIFDDLHLLGPNANIARLLHGLMLSPNVHGQNAFPFE
jgi:hypothetical protein